MFTKNELELLYNISYCKAKEQHRKVVRYRKQENYDSITLSKLEQKETVMFLLLSKINREIENFETEKITKIYE